MDRVTTERHLKQNKEIIRINQVQSNRIVALETEITKLLSENIQLRTQVIQLTHKQDLSAQKAQLERKLREIHRLVRLLGDASLSSSQSPVPAIIRKSPKKTNLLELGHDQSPQSSSLNFISSRSKPRSLAAPTRVARSPQSIDWKQGDDGDMEEPMDIEDARPQSPEASITVAIGKQSEQELRDKAREARRASRRMSRTSEEIVPLPRAELLQDSSVTGSPCGSRRRSSSTEVRDRAARRSSRASMSFETAPLFNSAESGSTSERAAQAQLQVNDDKENAPAERRSTTFLRNMHSSPKKSRTALNIIADPLPSPNIQAKTQTPAKPLKELTEVKSEPTSPRLEEIKICDLEARAESAEESGGRSRRGKTVNYAEPSLRHKMRRTESLPGDKRRKSTYRRVSSTLSEEARRSASAHQTITIEED